MRRETDHPHTLRDGTFHRVCHFHQLGLRLAVVRRFFLAFAAANLTSRKFCPRQSSCRQRLRSHFEDFQTLFEVVGLW